MSEIRYVGVSDRYLRLFERQYPVVHGITYNSYVIFGERPVVVDSVDAAFALQWLTNVEKALEGRCPAALVCQHLEPDHSGSLRALLDRYPGMSLIVSSRAASMLPHFLDAESYAGRLITVGEGDTYDLGDGSGLTFMMTPMVHWPEVMMTYLASEKTLFSADGFGTFGVPEYPQPCWADEAARYYFNIVGKFGPSVQAVLKKAAALDIEHIMPLHGPQLSGDSLAEALRLYDLWSRYEPDREGDVLVAVASIYGNTYEAALELASELGQRARIIDLTKTDVSFAVAEAFRCRNIVLAAASYDGGVFPPMAAFLSRLAVKGWRNRRVAIVENGSWSPCAARAIESTLSTLKGIDIVGTATVTTRLDSESRRAVMALAGAFK